MFRLRNAFTFFSFKAHLNYLNASFSFTSTRAKKNLKKKYVQKKHFLSEEENNCEEEINFKIEDKIAKPMATFGESFCLLLQVKSRIPDAPLIRKVL